MQSLITITTDFGDQFAVAQLHAVLAQDGFDGKIIDNHSVTPFSIIEGAFEISVLARFSPIGSIHIGVVDPGVGSDRNGIIIKTNKYWFVGPDNGLLFYVANLDGIETAWKLNESYFGNVSNTFHGRDVFVRAAALLAKNLYPEEFGCKRVVETFLKRLKFTSGQVVHIDSYGNVKINWEKKMVLGGHLRVLVNRKEIKVPVVKTFSDVGPGEPLAINGSSDSLELAVNLGRADDFFHAKPGEILEIHEIS